MQVHFKVRISIVKPKLYRLTGLYDNSHTVTVNTFLMELFSSSETNLSSPPELLARDEALLDYCESSDHPGFLSFWESTTYFVVLGYGKNAEREVLQEECTRLDI